MSKLIHSQDGVMVEELSLAEGQLRIGRVPGSDIQLDDVTVSGEHALITVSPSVYMEGLLDVHIEDQGSTNGTIVNGRPSKRHMLKHGDIAKIGNHEFAFIDEETRGFETTAVILPED